ncbi:MAG: nickel pincer cofactor biosynthesis protein LarC [Bacteroidales bacterium]|nr:nickel pincer cofactor biosynthesis protein LarC [Bacteroidales bacterium]
MKTLYYDCFAGISGDMNLAAMLDLGVPAGFLLSELQKLPVDGYKIDIKKELKMGIAGTKVDVITSQNIRQPASNGLSLSIDTKGNSGKNHKKNHITIQQHSHRSYSDIKKLIENSALSSDVKQTSISIFEKVAVAEAKIHNKTVGSVHFHEVGAVDSIVDIVGAAICYHYLKPDEVLCSTIELGGGFVKCAHGMFPVPAPATAEILRNIPVKLGRVQSETTTPTGAAILATLVGTFTDTPRLSIAKTAYGIGHRDLEIPNVLRVHLSETANTENTEAAIILECNIDDMPPEHYDYLIDKLLDEGAHDVFLTPIVMKKSRPATKLSVLCGLTDKAVFEQILFNESTTLGIRSYEVTKRMLGRRVITVDTLYGKIDVKVALLGEHEIKYKPEYEQCKTAAKKYNIPLRLVIDEVVKHINKEE